MKTLIIAAITCFFLVSGFVAEKSSFVVIGDETVFCDEVKVGKANTRVYSNNKQILKIETCYVDAYSANGVLDEKLPVIDNDKDTSGWAFMQFIASRNGYRLYRFCSNCVHFDPATGLIAPPTPVYRYYTFKDGKFVSMTDDNSVNKHLAYFGVRVRH